MSLDSLTTRTAPEVALLSIPEACITLGKVSRSTIYDLVNAGEITKVKIGARGFITAKSLAAYVDRLSKSATTGPAAVSRD